ncbi:NADP-dependent oxidoreductase [Streptomyces sp. NPDC001828]|uniref:NADP-dependent oxidoreductase n=1 Tax=Streptomyces sp. NPDC001828 TaxID=3364615 RepID=UPI00369BEDA3
MRAIVVKAFGEPDVLEVAEVAVPEPGAGQVRIRVRAATVNPVDVATRAGALAPFLPELDQYPLGWDVAGTVDALGEGVDDFEAGEAVVGLSDWFATMAGAQAEYIVLNASAVAIAPSGVPATEAATLPLNGLTALQALDLLGLSEGQSLVVTGAAGAVGGYALQLAARRGLKVYGVAGPEDREFVTAAGATFIGRTENLSEAVRAALPAGADGVLDTAVLGAAALAAVRDGGAYTGVFGPAAPEPERGIRVDAVSVQSNADQLAELVFLVESGALTLRVARTFGFDEAAEAHAQFAKGGTRGRLVLVP